MPCMHVIAYISLYSSNAFVQFFILIAEIQVEEKTVPDEIFGSIKKD